jgi:tRNA-dihydrouridine synthase B
MNSYKIGKIEVSPGLVLAPMSGVTTAPFRQLVRELNPGAVGLTVSEFISVEGLTRGSRRSVEMLKSGSNEKPYCIQIFGYDVSRMRDGAIMAEQAGADIVDINCGCPAPKVVRRGGGCELMRQPEHLAGIIAEVKKSISVPLTIKIRAGWDESSKNALEVAKIAESEGVSAIAVHGRTRTQLYRGMADWNIVYEIANTVKIPVLGSGDVVDRESALLRLKCGVSGMLIGRAAISNPFVFTEIFSGDKIALKNNPVLVLGMLKRYLQLLMNDFTPNACIGKFKQLVSQSCRGYEWRKDILTALTLEQQLQIMKDLEKRHGLFDDNSKSSYQLEAAC